MEWTEDELLRQGYQKDPDPGLADRTAIDRMIEKQAAHRESLLPCGQSAGQPLAEKETPAVRTEVDRLFPDKERVAKAQEFYRMLP